MPSVTALATKSVSRNEVGAGHLSDLLYGAGALPKIKEGGPIPNSGSGVSRPC